MSAGSASAAAAATATDPGARLSDDAIARIERETKKYPTEWRQSAVLAALAIAQDEIGWLPTGVMEQVAGVLGMAPVAVYEVATFYHMYQLSPCGRYKITICTNLPCALAGANEAARHLQQKLGIGFGGTSKDKLVTLVEGECMGACGDAPVLIVNNKRMCSNMSTGKLDELLAALAAGTFP
jgi:NADH-quinone oxidoreductase subunit E